MDYSFNGEVAKRYGVDEAVFIHNLYWWIAKNQANGRHYYDGRSWTYNSMKSFADLFPFWTERQVRRIIRKLKDEGAIHTGNYNQQGFDRTQWYALDQTVTCIYANGRTHLTEQSHPFDRTVPPIPDSKPDSKPDIRPLTPLPPKLEQGEERGASSPATPYQQIVDMYTSVCVSFPKIQRLSEARKKAIRARFSSGYTVDDFQRLFEKAEASSFLKGANDRNWQANFDWLIKDANMAKALDGNYDEKGGPYGADRSINRTGDGETSSAAASGGDERNRIRYGYVAGTEA